MRGGTGGALPEPNNMTSSWLLVCMFLTKLSETHPMRVAWEPNILEWDLFSQPSTLLLNCRLVENTRIGRWHPVLFTDESRFTLGTCDRHERVWKCYGEHYAANKILSHDWFGGWSVMVWGGISLEGSMDLDVIANGTLAAVRYWD